MRLIITILTIWFFYMFYADQWYLYLTNYFIAVTMLVGSFIAGASSEGGGAIAFPVMTLIYQIPPEVARNFSLGIQSIGMLCASNFIIRKGIPIEKKYLLLACSGGAIGIILGTHLFSNNVSAPYIKMLFFSIWLSFAFVLFYLNHINKRQVVCILPPIDRYEQFSIIIIGFIGGILTSITGSGIDIMTFSYVTMRYKLSEKVATPTSIIIMTVNSIIGFLIHFLYQHDFGAEEFNYWLVSIPVVIFGAPLGAFVISKLNRFYIAGGLYIIIVVQFIGAWIVIKPDAKLCMFSLGVFISGIVFFLISGRTISISKIFKRDP